MGNVRVFLHGQRRGLDREATKVKGLSPGLWPDHLYTAHSAAADHRLIAHVEGVLSLNGPKMRTAGGGDALQLHWCPLWLTQLWGGGMRGQLETVCQHGNLKYTAQAGSESTSTSAFVCLCCRTIGKPPQFHSIWGPDDSWVLTRSSESLLGEDGRLWNTLLNEDKRWTHVRTGGTS